MTSSKRRVFREKEDDRSRVQLRHARQQKRFGMHTWAGTNVLGRTTAQGKRARYQRVECSGRWIFLFYSWDHLTEAHHGPLLCFILLGCPGRPPGVLGYSDDNLHAGPIAPRPTANEPAHSISSSPAESNQRPPIIRRYKKSISISVQLRIEMGRLWPGFGGGGGLMLPKSILGSHFTKKKSFGLMLIISFGKS
jgi:hypothetical protein